MEQYVQKNYRFVKERSFSFDFTKYPQLAPLKNPQRLRKLRTISSIKPYSEIKAKVTNILEKKLFQRNLVKFAKDPKNTEIRDDIDQLINVSNNIFTLRNEFDQLKNLLVNAKDDYECEINTAEALEILNTPYFFGLDSVIKEFLDRNSSKVQDKSMLTNANVNVSSIVPTQTSALKTTSKLTKTVTNKNLSTNKSLAMGFGSKSGASATPASKTGSSSLTISSSLINNEFFESIYCKIGHKEYVKLLFIFEKYCCYGKSIISSLTMEFSQFNSFMIANQLFTATLTTKKVEGIFNKIKGTKKSITFPDFIFLLLELAVIFDPSEKSFDNKLCSYLLTYFLRKVEKEAYNEEGTLLRWYFILEQDDLRREVKNALNFLYNKIFLKNKAKDRNAVDLDGINRVVTSLGIAPTFITVKELSNYISFVKYQKKMLQPTVYIDFCNLVEIICLIALESLTKISQTETKYKYLTNAEKFLTFIDYLKQKAT